MHIAKAVITAAGPSQVRLPLQRFVDVDGTEKTALQIILEEVIAAGVKDVCVVVRSGAEDLYREAAGEHARMLVFVEQPEARGYGDALYRAAGFVGDEPFVHLVSDHLYVSRQPHGHFAGSRRTRPASIYWPPVVWWQWMAIRFLPIFSAALAAGAMSKVS